MALLDDKRFLLSHIRHSFITCDDTGMCETVMLNEASGRYPTSSLYHHPFDYDSDEDYDTFGYGDDYGDEEDNEEHQDDETTVQDRANGKMSQEDIDFFKLTEIDYKSELHEENPNNSFDVMSDSYDMMGLRRRSNTVQRLEKLKKERKMQAKTRVVTWKSPTRLVTVLEADGPKEKRLVLNPGALTAEELALLEFDAKENVYYETEAYRKVLFPYIPDDPVTPTNEPSTNSSSVTPTTVSPSIQEDDTIDDLPSDIPPLPTSGGGGGGPTAKGPTRGGRRKSLLTLQIESSPTAPTNPFNEYSRFDGRVSEGSTHTKRIRIFFTPLTGSPEFATIDFTRKLGPNSGFPVGPNWLDIVVLATAKISDLIGLICWNYTYLQIGPQLKPDPASYALKIAEENGEVDNDFPALTAGDDIKRYGFPYLALVQLETNILVTVFFDSEEVFSQITVNSLSTTLAEIVEQMKKKRPHLFRSLQGGILVSGPSKAGESPKKKSQLRVELRSRPGVALALSSKISEFIEASSYRNASVEFSLRFVTQEQAAALAAGPKINVLEVDAGGEAEVGSGSFKGTFKPSVTQAIRQNRSSIALFHLDATDHAPGSSPHGPSGLAGPSSSFSGRSRPRSNRDWSQNMLDMMEAPMYQCFEVSAVHKLYNTPVEMGISGTKVEISPRAGHSARSPNSDRSNFTDRLLSRFNHMKAVDIDVEDVVDCGALPSTKMELLGRAYFKLVYFNGSGDFKTLKFEGDAPTVDEILFKLNNVMKMRTSNRRNEYQALKSRKKSLSTKIYLRSRMRLSSSSSDSEDSPTTDDSSIGRSGTGLSTGAESVVSDAAGPDGGFFGGAVGGGGRRHKKADRFRRFKSRP